MRSKVEIHPPTLLFRLAWKNLDPTLKQDSSIFSSRADASLEEQAAPAGSGITPQEGCHEGVKPVCDGRKLTVILQKCIYNLGS